MGRYSLILIAGFAIIAAAMKITILGIGEKSNEVSLGRYEERSARKIAHSAAQMSLEQLKANLGWREGYSDQEISDGLANVEIIDSETDTTLGIDTVRVVSVGSIYNDDETVIMKVALGHPEFPENINAGITANSNVTTLGNQLVDGRDHDLMSSLISNNGVYAIRTTAAYNGSGSTALAGTRDNGNDYGPVRRNFDPIVEEYMVWPGPGSYPTTPEEVLGGTAMGLWDGIMKMVAQSGINGSQYVTDPANLTYPLQGITYVELPNRGEWNPVDFGENSGGLLIVHNAQTNAAMKNLNSGTFSGLIIADDMVHIQATILGSVFLLSPTPSEGNCIGNGTGSVLFSRAAVIKALEEAGLGLTNVTVVDVYE
jgi:hypothetical protein